MGESATPEPAGEIRARREMKAKKIRGHDLFPEERTRAIRCFKNGEAEKRGVRYKKIG